MLYDFFMAFWNRLTKINSKLGPGFVTGAADDDPSGIATYSIAGARYGYSMLWMAVFLIPSMVTIQEMCGRIGMVTGKGLVGVMKKFYSKKMVWFSVVLLTLANVINIGADLGIIASSLQMLFGSPFLFWLILSAVLIVCVEIFVPYKKYSGYLKWLALILLVYIVTGLMVGHNWREVLPEILIPRFDLSTGYIMTLVGFLGTTISPYLFFWQAGEEVEQAIAEKKIKDFNQKPEVSMKEIKKLGFDTKTGMIFSNMISFFIILTTAGTLNRNGILNIATPQMAAESLRPLAGDFAYLLFALGIIGIGLQAIPVLAGSIGYAVSEGLGIKEGLSKKFSSAKGFYLIIALATLIGVLINLLGINTMQALYYSAIINGVVALPLIAMVIKMADDERVVGRFKSKRLNKLIAWLTFGFMGVAVLFMFRGLIVGG